MRIQFIDLAVLGKLARTVLIGQSHHRRATGAAGQPHNERVVFRIRSRLEHPEKQRLLAASTGKLNVARILRDLWTGLT